MKRLLTTTILISFGATLFLSCQSTDLMISVVGDEGMKVTINVSAQTRTGIDDSNPASIHSFWHNGDQLGVWTSESLSSLSPSVAFTNSSSDAAAAAFGGTLDISAATTLYAVCPKGRIVQVSSADVVEEGNKVGINFRGSQTPSSNDSYDKVSEILIGQPKAVNPGVAGELVTDMSFGRLSSVVKMNFSGVPIGVDADTQIKSITLSAGRDIDLPENVQAGDVILAGNAIVSLENGAIDRWTAVSNRVSVNYTDPASLTFTDTKAYATVAPCVIPANTGMVISIKTADKYIRKEISSHPEIDLSAGSYVTFNVSLAGLTAVLLPTVSSVTTGALTYDIDGEGGYTATINGQYEAINATEYNKISYFFYYWVNGAKFTAPVLSSSDNNKNFSFDITGLHKNDVVKYQAVARYGGSAADNVKGAISAETGIDPDPILESSVSSATTVSADYVKNGDKYDITFHGSYASTNASATKLVNWRFRYKKGSASWSETGTKGTSSVDNDSFSATITGVEPGTVVQYQACAKGTDGTKEKQGEALTVNIPSTSWNLLYSWTYTSGSYSSLSSNGTNTSATLTTNADGTPIKASANGIYIAKISTNNEVYFDIPLTSYVAGKKIKVVFTKCFQVAESSQSYEISYKWGDGTYSASVSGSAPGTTAPAGVEKTYEFALTGNGTNTLRFRVKYTASGTTKFFFGGVNVYIEP